METKRRVEEDPPDDLIKFAHRFTKKYEEAFPESLRAAVARPWGSSLGPDRFPTPFEKQRLWRSR